MTVSERRQQGRMEWISFFDHQPEDGQDIWYYGEHIGVWTGKYSYSPDDPVSPHLIYCAESFGVVDRMDAPWWMPDDRIMVRPNKPTQPYPSDYPS
jgi:hypothetical protein